MPLYVSDFTPWTGSPPGSDPSNVPGLLVSEASLTVQSSPLTASTGDLIENMVFVSGSIASPNAINGYWITLPNGVHSVRVRNCYFLRSGANSAFTDGGAIMVNQGSGGTNLDLLVEHCKFERNYRAIRVHQHPTPASRTPGKFAFLYNYCKNNRRNNVFTQNADLPDSVVAYNRMEWEPGTHLDYNVHPGSGSVQSFVEDSVGFYNSRGTSSERMMIVGNQSRALPNSQWVGAQAGQHCSKWGAGYSVGDSGGEYSTTHRNLTLHTAANGIQASGGSFHNWSENFVWHTGNLASQWGSAGSSNGSWDATDGKYQTNRGMINQDWGGSSCAVSGTSTSNYVNYLDNNGTSYPYHHKASCAAPGGPESGLYGPDLVGPSTWGNQALYASGQAAWDGWQAEIDSLSANISYGRYGAEL